MIIEIDDPTTWPPELLAWSNSRAEELAGTTEYVSDLEVGYEDAEIAAFEALLTGHAVRVYHCTRLLDHEVAAVLRDGLQVGSENLVQARLHAAVANGYLTAELAAQLLSGNMLRQAPDQVEAREKVVCVCTTRSTLDNDADGVARLMLNWGGELIYHWQSDARDTEEDHVVHPWSLGVPSVVVGLLDIHHPGRHLYFPDLRNLFIGTVLDLAAVSGEMHYRPSDGSPLPVEAIWQPGSAEYDRHLKLPRRTTG